MSNELEKHINKILNEEETFMLSLMLLAHLHNDEKYKELSDLIFLFDDYNKFKKFIKYYEGQTIQVPTLLELKQTLRLLTLFQKVYLDGKDFDKTYDNLRLADLGLTPVTCREELEKFRLILKDDNSTTVNKLKKLTKKL